MKKELTLTREIVINRNYKNLKSLIIPSNFIDKDNDINYCITEIGESAFVDCKNLQSVILPPTITKIHKNAFCSCKKLTSIRFSNKLQIISDFAFSNTGIKNITIPSSVCYVGNNAFSFCEKLENVDFLPQEKKEEIVVDNACFMECVSLKKITLPSNLEYLQTDTFKNCISLSSLEFGSYLKILEVHAINNCQNLKELSFSKKLSLVDESSITDCKLLSEIKIEDNAFSRSKWNEMYKDSWK